MALRAGRYLLGTDSGQIVLHTGREGFAAQAGHDLAIDVRRWSAELTLQDGQSPSGLEARIDLNSLTVLEGTGGAKALTDRDRREIAVNARKLLGVDRHPEATFAGTQFEPGTDGGGIITGTLTLAGVSRPLRLTVTSTGPDHYHATGSVVQSEHGITPYRGFFGALKVRDAVDVAVDLDLSQPDTAQPGTGAQP